MFRRSISLLSVTTALGCVQGPPDRTRISDIAPAYAGTKVNTGIFRHHAVLTRAGTQYTSFYGPDGSVTLAWRRIGTDDWTIRTTGWKGNVRDAHNVISLGASPDGLLHISYDHHAQPLRYRRTERPGDPESFGDLIPMTGERENRVTYPQFFNLADGTLMFLYRDGSSGNGDLMINRYDPAAKSWSPVRHPVISGAGQVNAYWCRPAVGTDGVIHLVWCWRRTGDAATNHHICYARSRDGGATWETSTGKPCKMPITPANAEIVDPVGENHELSNQNSAEVDSGNRIHSVHRMADAAGIPQIWHVWYDGASWRKGVVTRFTEGFTMKGGGTLGSPVSRPELFIDRKDRVHVLYRDSRRGGRLFRAWADAPDHEDWTESILVDEDLAKMEPLYDIGRWKTDGVLNLFLLATDQGEHEKPTDRPPQMARMLEWIPE